MNPEQEAAALEGWLSNPVVQAADALVTEIAKTTAASRRECQAYVDLGLGRGWTLEQTRSIAFDCIAARIGAAVLKKAFEEGLWDDLPTTP